MSRLRVKLYAPQVPVGPGPRFAVRAAHALADHCDRTPGLEVSVTAAVADAAGSPLPWPLARFTPVTPAELKADPHGLESFARLTEDASRAFDVLFLPHPWKFYPAGRLTPTPTPFVAYVPDLDFDDADLGSVTDACRGVMGSLGRDCAAVVFPSAATRDRAVRRYGIDAARSAVVPPARSMDAPHPDARVVANALGLGEGFVLFLEAGRPEAADELRTALRAAGVERPVVVLAGSIPDDRTAAKGASEAGGVVRLSRLSDDEYRAVLSLAGVVVADTASATPFLDTSHLDALVLRRPLLCRSGAQGGHWAGDLTGAAVPFRQTEDAAAVIRSLLDDPGSFTDRLDRCERQARSRSEADRAAELCDLFRAVHEAPAAERVRFRAAPPACREKRILWLINHGAVHSCEVALLRSLGYEIYSPKQMPKTDARSLAVVPADDDLSTLPRWVLERLNRHNFYEDPLPEDLVELLNGYFGTAIISVWGTMFTEAVYKFRGRILARAFGREHPVTYFQYWDHFGGKSLWARIREIRHRFWLAAPYDSVGDWEPEPLRGRSVTLPLGIADRVWRNEGKWTGGQAKLFFICPSINLTPQYYGKVYRDFKYHFGDLPHLIAGNQETPVLDEAVTGKVPEGAFRRLMNELRVMYYHSREPRHLHYHPLEAIVHGMPVVYLTGGLMDYFGGPDQPGACETEADARRKIRRVLDGDRDLIDAIRARQGKILETFTDGSVREEWIAKFVGGVMATPVTPDALPPSRWTEPAVPAGADGPVPSDVRRVERLGVYLRSAPDPEAVRYAASLAGGAAAEGLAGQVECFIGNQAVGGRPAVLGGHPRLRVRLLREHEYLPRISVPKSQGNAVAAPDCAAADPGGPAAIGPPSTRRERAQAAFGAAARRLGEARISHRSRLVRTAATFGLAGLLYGRAVVKQRTLRTRGSLAVVTLKTAYHPGPSPLNFDQVRRITRRNDVTVFVHPTDLLAADLPIGSVEELPAVVVVHDLTHDFAAVGRDRSLARHRELRLWSKIARKMVFGSEHVRREAIRLYGIPPEKTHVIPLPPFVEDRGVAAGDEIETVRGRLGLPRDYVLSAGDADPKTNTLALLEAIGVLKWRRGSVPAVVFAGGDSGRLLKGDPADAYAAKVRDVLRDGKLVEGKEFFLLDRVSAEDLAGLYGGAAAYVTAARFESQVHGTVVRAMLAKRPVICGDDPANAERLGTGDEFALLVPPDDPAALADALSRILDDADDAGRRVERAYAWAKRLDGRAALDRYRQVIAAAAGLTSAEAGSTADAERQRRSAA